jgi:putative spermidine/putrescine transport system permease protein
LTSIRARFVLGGIAALVCLFSVAPVLVIVVESFTSTNYIIFPPPDFSLKWYVAIASRPEFIESATISLIIAVCASVSSTVLGTMSAIALLRHEFFGSALLRTLFLAPLSLPGLIFGLALLQFLAAWAVPRGIMTLIAAHVIITVPFCIRFISVALVTVGRDIELAAQSLGAKPIDTFRYVTLPLIRPGIFASVVFAFILSFDEVAATLFLSSPTAMTLPVRIFVHIDQDYDPLVTSVSAILVFIAVGALICIERTVGMARLFGMK